MSLLENNRNLYEVIILRHLRLLKLNFKKAFNLICSMFLSKMCSRCSLMNYKFSFHLMPINPIWGFKSFISPYLFNSSHILEHLKFCTLHFFNHTSFISARTTLLLQFHFFLFRQFNSFCQRTSKINKSFSFILIKLLFVNPESVDVLA